MATDKIDGAEVTRYQGRITGAFDLDDETQYFRKGDIVMAVVVLHANQLSFKDNTKGDCIGTYGFVVKDFAMVSDDMLRKNLYHHLPHLEPDAQLPFGEAVRAMLTPSEVGILGEIEEYHDLPDTIGNLDDADLVDSETGEVFSPGVESPERARVQSVRAKDALLQRFLAGD